MKIAVYTVITNGYDILIPPLHGNQADRVDFIVFSDEPIREQWGYTYRPVPKVSANPIDTSRYPKINSHLVLPEYDITVYVDANLLLIHPAIAEFAESVLADAPVAQFIHHERDCTYSEAEACIDRKLVDRDTVRQQVARYRAEGLPEKFGVANNCIIFRRHHDPRVVVASEIWWEEFKSHVKRDQIASEYSRWRAGLPINHIHQLGHDNEFAIRYSHVGQRSRDRLSNNKRILLAAVVAGRNLMLEKASKVLPGIVRPKLPHRYRASAFRTAVPQARIKGIRLAYHMRLPRFLIDQPYLVFLGCDRQEVMREIFAKHERARWLVVDASAERLAAMADLSGQFHGVSVETKWATLSSSGGNKAFYQQTDGTISADYRHRPCERLELETTAANEVLPDGRIDLLRINLAGLETDILEELAGYLKNVGHIHVEYHQLPGATNKLSDVTTLLEQAGFECSVTTTENPNVIPFQLHGTSRGMSYQYWIAGRRTSRKTRS